MLEISNRVKIMGSQHHGARFGSAISNIGDINNDGYPDIAVGAPYEEDGSGAIYIYHGKHNGLNSKYSQRISAQQIDSAIKGFGISISKGLDIDSNHYNDIAVGAYESGHGVLLRSRPIITFHSTLDSDVKKVNFNATGFKTRACLLYTGVYAPPNLDVMITLQVDTYYRRSNFVTAFGRNNTIQFRETLTHVAESCTELQVEILSINQDFTKPILIRMDYSVVDSSSKNLDHPNNHRERKKRDVDSSFCKSCPIVDPLHPTYETLKIPYATGCGADDVCQTNLKTEVALMNIE
ncbi:hypothetical protein J437_LFUL012003 [Ladona fulva]|uniref:Integrin alpha first immunoglubulin-like domain-containing protein n=1 Tax=Ladona fulva TaxID=123851 RepID=A0A8K0KBR4_LADFU|nr:hypothetical protein J437_LFUL012003 [Ladona fulva]